MTTTTITIIVMMIEMMMVISCVGKLCWSSDAYELISG